MQTTDSRHWLSRHSNLVRDAVVSRPEQVWASDITYIRMEEGSCYINLVTDARSRKIMGFAIADNMKTRKILVWRSDSKQNSYSKKP